MKTLDTIAKEAAQKDYHVVAEIANCSPKNVQMVVKGKRTDNYNIQEIFSGFLLAKEELKKNRVKKGDKRNPKRSKK